jgi:glutathione synthase/RimK-type ligase-like ATP-grasp enzyme
MYRYSLNGDFRANITNGGKMKAYEPSREEISLAISCCNILNLTFGGVDILLGRNNKPIVCEVNSNAHFKNIYECTKVNTAQKIIEHIVQVLKKA